MELTTTLLGTEYIIKGGGPIVREYLAEGTMTVLQIWMDQINWDVKHAKN